MVYREAVLRLCPLGSGDLVAAELNGIVNPPAFCTLAGGRRSSPCWARSVTGTIAEGLARIVKHPPLAPTQAAIDKLKLPSTPRVKRVVTRRGLNRLGRILLACLRSCTAKQSRTTEAVSGRSANFCMPCHSARKAGRSCSRGWRVAGKINHSSICGICGCSLTSSRRKHAEQRRGRAARCRSPVRFEVNKKKNHGKKQSTANLLGSGRLPGGTQVSESGWRARFG